jgi:predicted RNA-binding protein associated with RNAse of E/G family
MSTPFKEIRLHKNKAPQEFLCSLLFRTHDYLVLAFQSHTSSRVNGRLIEKGSTTTAHYWSNRNYTLWKFIDSGHNLIGYLFYICTDVVFGKSSLTYMDLELDIWIDPDGRVSILDQEEVNACLEKGLINAREHSLIEKEKNNIVLNFKDILQNTWNEEALH